MLISFSYTTESTTKTPSSGDGCYDSTNDPLVCYTCSDISGRKCSKTASWITEKTSPSESKCDYRYEKNRFKAISKIENIEKIVEQNTIKSFYHSF